MDLTTLGGIGGATIALTQLIKIYVPERFVPLVAVALGVGVSLLIELSVPSAVNGLIAGLVACGVYDQKTILK